jgi:hypothetical protein
MALLTMTPMKTNGGLVDPNATVINKRCAGHFRHFRYMVVGRRSMRKISLATPNH